DQHVPGLSGVGGKVKDAIDGWKKVDATIGANAPMSAQWNRVAYSNEQTLGQLRAAMRNTIEGITRVEGYSDSGFVDRRGALANLRIIQSLLDERINLATHTQDLIEEHLLALGEFKLAQSEWELAELEVEHAEDQVHKLRCRLGLPAGN